MPYHINTVGPGKFEVVDDQGKVAGTHPTRKQALAQLKALYANVPEAKELFNAQEMRAKGREIAINALKEDGVLNPSDDQIYQKAISLAMDSLKGAEDMDATDKATADINNLPDSAFLYVESGGDKDEDGRTVPRSLRHLPYKTQDGGIDLPKLRNALSRLGQSATGNVGGESWLTEGVRKSLISKAQKILADNTDAASAQPEKKEAQEPPSVEQKQSILDRVIATLKGDSPGHPFRGNQFEGGSGGGADAGDSGGIDTPVGKVKVGNVVRIKGPVNWGGKVTKISDGNIHVKNSYTQSTIKVKPSDIAEVREVTGKEGRRNSSPDGDRLQQIHDLAVLNGASCPMVMKEASGKLRWVLLSSNAFIDSDKEIISTKALESDVERTDKAAAPYGPLRWWHLGAPDPIALNAGSGADIGDCDYRAMSGRVLIESGTFRNERIGEAIKEHANTLAGSIGFFHPKDEPDSEGVYRNIVQFERSLLPRGKASNQLTALTVKGEESMATSKEKQDALAALLGDQSLAESVIKQAEATEKAAEDRGLKYKEQEKPAEAAPVVPEVAATTKAPAGEPTAVPAHGESGLMKAFGLEPDDDEATCKEKIGKVLNAMMEAKMGAGAKETAEKEAGLNSKIAALEASVKELVGDMPRGLQSGFRASLADATILKDINFKNAPSGDPLDSVIDQLMGVKK